MNPLRRLAGKYDSLVRRERVLIFAAVVCGLMGALFALVIDPAMNQSKVLRARVLEHRTQLTMLGTMQDELNRQLQHDINAQIRGRIDSARRDLEGVDERIKGLHQTLIPASAMAKVMAGVLAHESSVQLISLRNIAAEPLDLDSPEGKREARALLYRHGIELVVEGGYFDLLNYLSNLEKQSWRMIWAETVLSAEYPKSRLRLKLFTLSMDPTWLSV